MKRLISIIISLTALLCLMLAMTGCFNKQIIDATYSYDKAIIKLPNGNVVQGAVDSWRDYEDGDQIQVKIDGITYLVHSSNVCLINE